jgi:hypothetical protein
MANLYFCQPHARNQGMLRAVLSREDCETLVGSGSAVFLGDKFPSLADSQGIADFAVLKIADDEANAEWRSGFYRLEADLVELNTTLMNLAR